MRASAPLLAMWWVLVGAEGSRAAHTETSWGRCTPCNSHVTVKKSSDLPQVGFICPEGSADGPLHHPYTCLVFFNQSHNLTIHLHHFHPDHMSVMLCSMRYHNVCADLKKVIRYKDVGHPVYLNITTLPRGPTHHQQQARTLHAGLVLDTAGLSFTNSWPLPPHAVASPLPTEKYSERRRFNFTYEIRSPVDFEPVIDGLEYAHLGNCSYNGIPVLHQLSRRKFRFSCQCTDGASGDHCQLGGLCTGGVEDLRSWCNQHGECRYIQGESICACEQGYHGGVCQHHYTTIPSYDQTCGGLLDCQHNCHLRVESRVKYADCSCSAGYVSTNTTHCQAQEDWDVTVKLKTPRGALYQEAEVINRTLRTVAAVGGAADASNISVTIKSGEVKVEVGVEGTVVARRLTHTIPWTQQFDDVRVLRAFRIPKLSVGPVSAELTEGSVLLLRCPVYGGPLLNVSWYKDTNLIYSHIVPACSYSGGTSRLRVVAEQGTADHECTILMLVFRPEQVDRGTYICQVSDRGYQARQMVLVGSNQSLQLDITPRVLTINQGEGARLACTTRNRGWVDPQHFSIRWHLHPTNGYTHTTITPIHRRGATINIFNITMSLKVTCTMEEKKGLMWMPVDVDGDAAHKSVKVNVLNSTIPLTCSDDLAYGITWRTTPVDHMDEVPCPEGYRGEAATRYCRSYRPDLSPFWTGPDASPTEVDIERPLTQGDTDQPLTRVSTDQPLSLVNTHMPQSRDVTSSPSPWNSTVPQPSWDVPDFSSCVYMPLFYLKTLLYLFERGYNSLPEDLESLAKDLLKIQQERVKPILPGEGSSVIDVLEMLEVTEHTVLLPVFVGIVHTVAGQRNALSVADTWRMLQLTMRNLRAFVELPLNESEEVRLPSLVVKVARLHTSENQVYTMYRETQGSSESDRSKISLLKVHIGPVREDSPHMKEFLKEEEEVPSEESVLRRGSVVREVEKIKEVDGEMELEDLEESQQEKEVEAGMMVGLVAFLNLHPSFYYHLPGTHSEDFEEATLVEAPLVGVVGEKHQAESTSTTLTSSGTANDPALPASATTFISHLTYSTCPQKPPVHYSSKEGMSLVPSCGRVEMVDGALKWDLTPCSLLEASGSYNSHDDGNNEAGVCLCRCRGPGLFALLLVRPIPPEILQKGSSPPEWKGRPVVAGSCLVSATVTVVCLLQMLPRVSLTTIQLRLLKCLALSGVNITFAAFAAWPTSQEVQVGVRVVGSTCLVLCVGVGVSQQMALHQHLAITTHTKPISPTHTTTIAVFVISCVMGMVVWIVQRLHYHNHLGTQWMPLGEAWGVTAAILGSLGVVSLLWVVLAGHNIRKLTLIKNASPNHRGISLVSGRMRQLTLVVVGEWILIFTSLFQHYHLGQYFFCLASLTQSIVIMVMYTYSGNDITSVHCCCQMTHTYNQPTPEDHKERRMESREDKGCMDGLMACRMPRVHTYECIPGGESSHLKYNDSEFRGRGGSLWSQTTTTVVLPETGELVHSPTDPAGPSIHHLQEPKTRLPLYARGSNIGPTGAMRPRNLFLRGTNLVCGEDVTSPQENILSASSLAYEDMEGKVSGRKRNLSFHIHQPVIHEMPQDLCQDSPSVSYTQHSHPDDNPKTKYLDMSIIMGKKGLHEANLKSSKCKNDVMVRGSYVNVDKDPSKSSIVANSQVCPEPNTTEPFYANAGVTSTSNTAKNQCSRSPHHRYLSMEVKGKIHMTQTYSLEESSGNSALQKHNEITDKRIMNRTSNDNSEEQNERTALATSPKKFEPVKSNKFKSKRSLYNAEQFQNDDTCSDGTTLPTDGITLEGREGSPAVTPPMPDKDIKSICDQLDVCTTSTSMSQCEKLKTDNEESLSSVSSTGYGTAGDFVSQEVTEPPPNLPAVGE